MLKNNDHQLCERHFSVQVHKVTQKICLHAICATLFILVPTESANLVILLNSHTNLTLCFMKSTLETLQEEW